MTRRPLNPSIKFAQLITNKKHNKTKIEEKISFSKKFNRNGISMLNIPIDIK